MCGITLAYSSDSKKAETFIHKGLDIISHRGQDSVSRVKVNDLLHLGHRRLAITGTNGIQPMFSDELIIMTNGEFYDYLDIKQQFPFFEYQSDSDAEILIPLYLRFGLKKMMDHLNGEFVFVVIDKIKNEIHLVRDLVGNKTLYYSVNGKELFVASEIKAFKSIKKLKFDENVLAQKLSMQYHHPKDTLFEGIKQVEPGSIVSFNYQTGTLEISFYEELYENKQNGVLEYDHILKLLKKSVERRINNQNPAIALSGGLDSSIILDLVQEIKPELKDCFSISFKNGGIYDESKLVNLLAEKYNLRLNLLEVSQQDLMHSFSDSLYSAEDVAVNMHMPAKYLLFQEMKKQGFKVSLSGEGSDEFFFGYTHFYPMQDNYLKGMHLPEQSDSNDLNPLFIQAKLAIGNKIKTFLNKDIYFTYKDNEKLNISEVEKSAKLWSKYALSNSILVALGDKMEMASTIEGRTPFLDKDLLRYVMSLKLEDKYSLIQDKVILRTLFKNRLPAEIIEKNKHPFIAPPLISSPEGRQFYSDTLNAWKHPLINHDKLNNKLQELENIKDIEQDRLFDPVFMILSSLAVLQKRMIDD